MSVDVLAIGAHPDDVDLIAGLDRGVERPFDGFERNNRSVEQIEPVALLVQTTLPVRAAVNPSHTWDLTQLFEDDQQWDAGLDQLQDLIPGAEAYRGQLGESAERLAAGLEFELKLDRLAERLSVYAYLRTCEDQTDSHYQAMLGRFQNVAVQADEAMTAGHDDPTAGLPLHLGDVIICPAVARDQAPQHSGSEQAELSLLVIHGVLHVLGHDHAKPDEAAAMQARERHHLASLGYEHPGAQAASC